MSTVPTFFIVELNFFSNGFEGKFRHVFNKKNPVLISIRQFNEEFWNIPNPGLMNLKPLFLILFTKKKGSKVFSTSKVSNCGETGWEGGWDWTWIWEEKVVETLEDSAGSHRKKIVTCVAMNHFCLFRSLISQFRHP